MCVRIEKARGPSTSLPSSRSPPPLPHLVVHKSCIFLLKLSSFLVLCHFRTNIHDPKPNLNQSSTLNHSIMFKRIAPITLSARIISGSTFRTTAPLARSAARVSAPVVSRRNYHEKDMFFLSFHKTPYKILCIF